MDARKRAYAGEIGRHTSELQSPCNLVCRLLLEKKKKKPAWRPRRTSSSQRRRTKTAMYELRSGRAERDPVRTQHLEHECLVSFFYFFFFNDTATTEIYTLSLHDALPICDNDIGKAQALAGRFDVKE